MTANEILQQLLAACDWVNPAQTVDRIVAGDGDRPVRTVLVTWISSLAACRTAIARGVDLLVTHEPTFWRHLDDFPEPVDQYALAKQREIREAGLTILRLHDSWDRFPGVGIPFAWAQYLGLPGAPVATGMAGYLHRYDVAPTTAGAFARQVAVRTAALGEPVIQFAGDPGAVVSRIGTGTGCACDPAAYQAMGCDLAVVCDDGTCSWGHLQRAADLGLPVIRVNHGTSEEPGMLTLAAHLRAAFPGLQVEHLPHPCCYAPMRA